jgi:hypothetical protein
VLGHREGVADVVVAVRDREELDPTQRARDRQPDLRSLIDRRSGGGNLVEHLPRRSLRETPHEPVAEMLGGELLLRRGDVGTADVRDDECGYPLATTSVTCAGLRRRVPTRGCSPTTDPLRTVQEGAYAYRLVNPWRRSDAFAPGRAARRPPAPARTGSLC